MKILHRIAISALAAVVIFGTAVIGRIVLMSEQTQPEPPDPEPLVINTVERQDEGDDGKAYGIIYMDGEEVTK